MLAFLMKVFPMFLQWLEAISESSDDEFEEISKAWPKPTKLDLAWARAELKALKHYSGGK